MSLPDATSFRDGNGNRREISKQSFWFGAVAILFDMILLAAFYAVTGYTYGLGSTMLGSISGLGFVFAVIWVVLNRRSAYWAEFQQHRANARSAGDSTMPRAPFRLTPMPRFYLKRPDLMSDGIAAISLADLLCVYWAGLFVKHLIDLLAGTSASPVGFGCLFAIFVIYTTIWIYAAAKRALIKEIA